MRSCGRLLVALCLAGTGWSTRGLAVDPMTTSDMVPEVISRAESPHAYDWRAATFELQLGIGEVLENNNFNTAAYELAGGVPMQGSMLRFGLRRVDVFSTPSSDDIGRTPFKQAAQSTRYELFTSYAFGLLEGRAMTRFSPLLPDVENTLFLTIGAHYSHPNASLIPRRSDTPPPLNGQEQVNANFVLELGLRYQVYLPQNFGLAIEAVENLPLGSTDALHHWAYFDGGVLWSFGAR